MGSINLDNLKFTDKISPDFTYVDLHLDLAQQVVGQANDQSAAQGKDIKVDFDEDAIRNSILNILNTIPGERFLIPDFGIKEDQMNVVFSGHRGYHLKIENEDIRTLSSDERREIVDYVTGKNISLEILGLRELGG